MQVRIIFEKLVKYLILEARRSSFSYSFLSITSPIGSERMTFEDEEHSMDRHFARLSVMAKLEKEREDNNRNVEFLNHSPFGRPLSVNTLLTLPS